MVYKDKILNICTIGNNCLHNLHRIKHLIYYYCSKNSNILFNPRYMYHRTTNNKSNNNNNVNPIDFNKYEIYHNKNIQYFPKTKNIGI